MSKVLLNCSEILRGVVSVFRVCNIATRMGRLRSRPTFNRSKPRCCSEVDALCSSFPSWPSSYMSMSTNYSSTSPSMLSYSRPPNTALACGSHSPMLAPCLFGIKRRFGEQTSNAPLRAAAPSLFAGKQASALQGPNFEQPPHSASYPRPRPQAALKQCLNRVCLMVL